MASPSNHSPANASQASVPRLRLDQPHAEPSSIQPSLMLARSQRTLARPISLSGVGLFTNSRVNVEVHPAAPNTGIRFQRADLPGQPSVPAHITNLKHTPRRTTLAAGRCEVQMVEHTLAALAGLSIDNATVVVDGPEMPGLDGSSDPLTQEILSAGIIDQAADTEILRIATRVSVDDGSGGTIVAEPALNRNSYEITYLLDHPKPVVGRQSARATITPETFAAEISSARTFVMTDEVDALKAAGYGQSLTERDLCVFGDDGVIGNSLRFPNEPARHKLLDCVGDFALAGVSLIGRITASRSGHALNQAFVKELLRTHVDVVTLTDSRAA